MSGLRLRDVSVTHPGGRPALAGVTLDVPPGELLAVVGPSGSGKTTLLRAVAGLAAVRGRVEIDGKDVTGLSAPQRNVAMVFETAGLLPFLDVAGNVGFGLRLRHVPREETRQRVSDEARRLRLTRFLHRKPGGLSAGERGRVSIGRALVRAPAVWLLDEPLAHLDPTERFEVRHWLVREVKRQGVATLYVTHDPTEALAVGDRVAVLRRGQVVQVDTPHNLYARPASAFVADFVASQQVGLLPARVVRAGGLAGFEVGARTLPFWDAVPPELEASVGKAVVLGLRPEDVRDAGSVDDPDATRLHGTVVATEFTGPDLIVTVEVDAPTTSLPDLAPPFGAGEHARLQARLPRDSTVQLGSRLMLAVDARRAHVFEPATGAALWHPPDPADPALTEAAQG
jgi:multiple sugar transport system ATP-binding protein